MRGIVDVLVSDRGFGFIAQEEDDSGRRKFFFHRTALSDPAAFTYLSEGDEVDFQPVEPQPAKGPRAEHVVPAAAGSEESRSFQR